MRIAKPVLLVLTPIGVAGGLYEAYRFGGGLVILMAALLALMSTGMLLIVLTIRKERRAEVLRQQEEALHVTQAPPTVEPPRR